MNYDVVILPCEGAEDDTNNLYADNVAAYANAGGRLFTSHFGYTWLATPTLGVANPVNPATGNVNQFYGVANWGLNAHPVYSTNAAISTTLPSGQPFPKGQAFASWAANVQALSTQGDAGAMMGDGGPSSGSLVLSQAHNDVTGVNAPTTMWIQEPAPNVHPYFLSFDTPVSAGGTDSGAGGTDSGAGACGRVDYSEFHVPSSALVNQAAGGACTSISDCGFTATCVQGAVGTCGVQQCATNADCGSGTAQDGGVQDAGVAANYQCVGAAPNTCVPQTCILDADCFSQSCVQGTCACTQESDCASLSCTGGKCLPSTQACTANFQCGAVEQCAGAKPGTCQGSCSTNADCTQGQLCVSGLCQGCHDVTNCPSKVCNGASPSKCSASSMSFPLECKQGSFSPEEDALEFMLLDLSACISPDSLPPPLPSATGSVATGPVGLTYSAATFTEDFTSSCPQGTHVAWRTLDWQAAIPATASIVFSAQTAAIPPDGGPLDYSGMMPVLLATATATASTGPAYIDMGTMGAFNMATPPVISSDALRLTVTLYPTANGTAAPTLQGWQVKADCLPSE
jgi:hypothetical protein